jgi:hypothetical protein
MQYTINASLPNSDCVLMTKYTVKEFNERFPDDAACLDFFFKARWPDGGTCECGKKDWFYVFNKASESQNLPAQ